MQENIIKQEISKSGELTLKYKNVYLHSKYNPKKEAMDFIEKKYKSASIQILIGYGAGYIYNALQNKKNKDEKILVIDPIFEPIDEVEYLHDFDIKNIKHFLNKNIQLVDTLNCIVSINYDKIIDESVELQKFITLLREKISSNKVSENTIAFFNSQWNENYLRNLKYASTSHSIKELFSKKDFPIVVASGGPSLTKQLPLVKKYRDKIVLIAAGTTINSLLKSNIRPDMVVSVDGGEVNYNHFKDLQIDDFPLIYCPTVHYGIRSHFQYAYHCFLTVEESLIPHYELYTKESVETLLGGSSVAHTAYNLALFLSNGPVALIGQDLAYTNGQTHAKGNLNRKEVNNKKLIVKEGYYGKNVETDEVFLQMRDGFERIQEIMQASNRSFNCTEGGLKIHNFQQKGFQEFLDKYAIKKIAIDYNYTKIDLEKNKEQYYKQLEQDIVKHKRLIELFTKALDELRNNKSDTSFSEEVLDNLNALDSKIQENLKKTNLNYAFGIVNLRVLRYFKPGRDSTIEEQYKIALQQNKYMYGEMLKVTEESLSILKELLEERILS